MQLQGDFDGTSAHELADILNVYGNSRSKVTIDTEGLKSINAFGLDVFIIRLKSTRRFYASIIFTGKFKTDFAQE